MASVRPCQRGIGGIFDACELPEPVGPGPYLDLAFSIGALDSNLTLLALTSPLRGAREKLRDPVFSAIEALETPFVSVNNTVSANTTPNASDVVANGDLLVTRQELLNDTADYVFDAFGSGAINELFVGSGSNDAAMGINGRIGYVVLHEPPLGDMALSLVANAYATSTSETYQPILLRWSMKMTSLPQLTMMPGIVWLWARNAPPIPSAPASAEIACSAASTRPWRGSRRSRQSHNLGAISVRSTFRTAAD